MSYLVRLIFTVLALAILWFLGYYAVDAFLMGIYGDVTYQEVVLFSDIENVSVQLIRHDEYLMELPLITR